MTSKLYQSKLRNYERFKDKMCSIHNRIKFLNSKLSEAKDQKQIDLIKNNI